MADESRARQGTLIEGAREDRAEEDDAASLDAVAKNPCVFVADAAAEGSRIADVLRMAGYAVYDVPLSTLASRAQVQRPNVVLLDVDAHGALEAVADLRRAPGAAGIELVYFGTGEGPVRSTEEAIGNDGCAFFARPVDIGALVRKIEAMTGGPAERADARSSTPPPSLPATRNLGIFERPSLPAPGVRTPGSPLPMSAPSISELGAPPRSLATYGTVSNELQQLLADAELRADALVLTDATVPSPEEEIETVLPAEVLASLDEPIEANEEEEPYARGATGAFGREGTGHGKHTTSGGSRQTTTSSGRATESQTHERRLSDAPARDLTPARRPSEERRRESASLRAVVAPTTELRRPELAASATPLPSFAEPSVRRPHAEDANQRTTLPVTVASEAARARGESEAPPQSSGVVIVEPTDARRALADAIASRRSGALSFDEGGVVRRVVLRDGDLVTAASSAEGETLVAFLGARGDLPRDEVERLLEKVPPYGRHAGAALIAHGWLEQDQLWSALRAHAEWIAALALRTAAGTVALEPEPPGRLRYEPSVFAASTGGELFVELVRRAVAPEEALDALGGDDARVADGPASGLLAECALSPTELELLSRARGGTVGDVLSRAPDAEIASVLHALALLGVIDVIPAAESARPATTSSSDLETAALDDEAIRARVRARLELVEEGDYFSVLGVPRDATSYEIRRAFVELRRAFEPARLLSPRLADLADDVRKIVVVLEEAYEILRDAARRERYRRAIDAQPG